MIVGKGAIDFPGLFRALVKIGYQGHVGLEYEIDVDNPLPGMLQSFAYMRGRPGGNQADVTRGSREQQEIPRCGYQ